MKNHIFRHQTFITIFLSTIFALLIAIKIVYPERNLDIPFSLVAGWFGIVIGFFFNQQIADFFRKKYIQSESEKRQLSEETKKVFDEYVKTEEKIVERNKEIHELIKKEE